MSLKLVVALFVAGLVAQSHAFALKNTRQSEYGEVSGFSYTNENKELSLSAPNGEIVYISAFVNTTAWSFSIINGLHAITQKIQFSYNGVAFGNIKATAGAESTETAGMYVHTGDSVFDFIIKAGGTEETCNIAAMIVNPQISARVILANFGSLKGAFEAVRSEVEAAVKEVLEKDLAQTYSAATAETLAVEADMLGLCRKLRTATEDDFPQPKF